MSILKKSTFIVYGVLTGVAMTVHSVIMYRAHVPIGTLPQYLCNMIFLAGILLNAFAYSKANNNYVLFSDVYKNCFKEVIVIALIFAAGSLICLLLFPSVKMDAIEMSRHFMAGKNIPPDKIEKGIANIKDNFISFAVFSAGISTIVWGAVFSLIGAAIVKKKGKILSTEGKL